MALEVVVTRTFPGSKQSEALSLNLSYDSSTELSAEVKKDAFALGLNYVSIRAIDENVPELACQVEGTGNSQVAEGALAMTRLNNMSDMWARKISTDQHLQKISDDVIHECSEKSDEDESSKIIKDHLDGVYNALTDVKASALTRAKLLILFLEYGWQLIKKYTLFLKSTNVIFIANVTWNLIKLLLNKGLFTSLNGLVDSLKTAVAEGPTELLKMTAATVAIVAGVALVAVGAAYFYNRK